MRQGEHGGDIHEVANYLGVPASDVYDYSSNVSPYPIDISVDKSALSRLPEPYSRTLAKAFAEKYGYDEKMVCITAGTTEAIDIICRIFAGKSACIKNPTYADYKKFCKNNKITVRNSLPVELYFICNPNNPTGQTCPREFLPTYFKTSPSTLFVIDESYMPFHIDEPMQTLMGEKLDNIAILRSFSKIYGLPGLRLGAVIANEKLIEKMKNQMSPWSVNSLAQSAGLELLDVDTAPIAKRLNDIKVQFLKELESIDFLEAVDSDVNYMMCKMKRGTSDELFRHCLNQRVLIRDCSNFEGLDNRHVRFAMADDMSPLLEALKSF
ncbi:aminotransferase class I and II [Denitrovibrio acetiphilus DSM 12809]|jgi:threonine-phosphate decarboxylase|uniref:Aminotransferase n=1 Tax=Denitrovibrio acetiphilus (strain DSM 12809 / NBRC 114555 / N2460) TaxID=522772 RepID=D4H1X8_DENA2|nr:aminotransferase class I/II-fold pyridoxal phosphate-dependent enzyme [Denitrovibrio acetiphilus]ADD66955.1 aminotransferase class I and II [Denitrovibrio acetiphilus DSM 12809]